MPKKDIVKLARHLTNHIFQCQWDEVPNNITPKLWIALKPTLENILPTNIEKSVHYDLEKNPGKYLKPMMLLCQAMLNKAFSFLHMRTSCVPCHFKLDTECVAQLFMTVKERTSLRKEFDDRKAFNEEVWKRVLNMDVVKRKLCNSGWTFHHEMYSRQVATTSSSYQRNSAPADATNGVGLDPGKHNILTMIDGKGHIIKYSAAQRNFESRLTKYEQLQEKESEKNPAIKAAELALSKYTAKANDYDNFKEYLKAKANRCTLLRLTWKP